MGGGFTTWSPLGTLLTLRPATTSSIGRHITARSGSLPSYYADSDPRPGNGPSAGGSRARFFFRLQLPVRERPGAAFVRQAPRRPKRRPSGWINTRGEPQALLRSAPQASTQRVRAATRLPSDVGALGPPPRPGPSFTAHGQPGVCQSPLSPGVPRQMGPAPAISHQAAERQCGSAGAAGAAVAGRTSSGSQRVARLPVRRLDPARTTPSAAPRNARAFRLKPDTSIWSLVAPPAHEPGRHPPSASRTRRRPRDRPRSAAWPHRGPISTPSPSAARACRLLHSPRPCWRAIPPPPRDHLPRQPRVGPRRRPAQHEN